VVSMHADREGRWQKKIEDTGIGKLEMIARRVKTIADPPGQDFCLSF